MPTLTVLPSGKKAQVEAGMTLLAAVVATGEELRTKCTDESCSGECHVFVPQGKKSLSKATREENAKLDTIVGPIDFTAPLIEKTGTRITDWPAGPGHKTKNVYDHGLGAAQWLMQGGKWTFDEVPIDNTGAPYMAASSLTPPKPLPIS